ncbi:MAG: TetR/AcrR family transcriptional regulator [Deltaproteobacteria bacterium]|nr:TetR/AcrR family transcriptional regulator [Deltaproteobacteria bacterium]
MATKRKRLTAAERKPQIMRSAIKALARSNYRTTSIAEIAAEAGITEPAVYRYFPTKKALFISILEDVGNRVLRIWEAILDESSGPLDALTKIAGDYYERAMTRRGELKVLFQALSEVDDQDIRRALRVQFASYVDLLETIIRRAQADDIIHQHVDAAAAAWSFLSVGFTLNLVGLLRLETDLSRDRLELIQTLFLESLLVHNAQKTEK